MTPSVDLPLVGAGGEPVDLRRTLLSHGFADLPPLLLDQAEPSLTFTVRPSRGRPRRVCVSPGGRRDHVRIEILGPRIGASTVTSCVEAARLVLRLDQDLSAFYDAARDDPDLDWVTAGAGRMLRSPTVFEDVIKTVCTTNCSWALTTKMVTALVRELGESALGFAGDPLANAFPTPAVMAAQPERFYRDVVRAGYRAPYFRELARLAAGGEIDLEGLGAANRQDLPDDELEGRLLALPGVGPYAAAHIMMTLGRNSRLILDSWTRPAYAKLRGRRTPSTDAAIRRRFARYGPDAGLAFWLFVTRDWVE